MLKIAVFLKWVSPDHKRGSRLRRSRLSAESLSTDLAVINSSEYLKLNFCFTSLLLHLGLLFGYKLSPGYIVMMHGILP